MRTEPECFATTEDAALDGRLRLRQPLYGHRFGHDAVLLAAATAAAAGDHVVELGAGVGLAGLALALRVPQARLTLIDVDPRLVALAAENADRNGLAARVRALNLDATAPPRAFAAAGLPPETAQRVMMNPPYNDPARFNRSPQEARAVAHMASAQDLNAWCRAAARLLAPRGTATLIWRADGLMHALAALSGRFGGLTVLPVHPRPGAAAIRILASGVKGSRAPLRLLPALTLADENGAPTPQAEAVLRAGAALAA